MGIRKLVGFVTIVDLGSINAAARQLSVSQPALARTVRLMTVHLQRVATRMVRELREAPGP